MLWIKRFIIGIRMYTMWELVKNLCSLSFCIYDVGLMLWVSKEKKLGFIDKVAENTRQTFTYEDKLDSISDSHHPQS